MEGIFIAACGVLVFYLFLLLRQYRFITGQGAKGFATKRLYIDGAKMTANVIGFSVLLFVVGAIEVPLIQALFFSVISFVLLNWIMGDFFTWALLRYEKISQETLASFLKTSLFRFAFFILWAVPLCLSLIYLVGSDYKEGIYIVPMLILACHYLVIPSLQVKLKSALAPRQCKLVAPAGLYEDINSRTSSHMNARALVGVLKSFIVYTHALRNQLSEAEFKAVLCHELGHIRKRHHLKWVIFKGVIYSLSFWVVIQSDTASFMQGLILAIWAKPIVDAIWMGLSNSLMKRFEFEADSFAVTLSEKTDFKTALQKIWAQNQTAYKNDPWFDFFMCAHPSNEERLMKIG